jgi:NAD(P)-dependent dehydrogenase (short-subunit alcohol dehydrogenase family)
MNRFNDQTVLVTGASRGIGAATARAFAAEGARIAVNYRSDEEGAVATVDAISAAGGAAQAFQADVGIRDDVEALAGAVERDLGPVDVLVNNAAFIDRSVFLDVEIDVLEHAWNVNVRGVYQLSQLVAARMAERNGGAIVHLSSILARLAVASRTAYITTKGAIEALTRSMALDLAPHGIRVNAVAPGLIATEALLAGMPDKELQDEVQRFIPERRFGRPEEITAAILFAASPEASYLNGSIIGVDGGLGGAEAGPVRD